MIDGFLVRLGEGLGRTIKYPHQWLFEKGWTYYEIIHNNDYMNTICITKKSLHVAHATTIHHLYWLSSTVYVYLPHGHIHISPAPQGSPLAEQDFHSVSVGFPREKKTPKHVTRTAGRVKNWVIYSSNLAYHFFHDYFFSQSLTYIYPIRSHHVSCIFAEVWSWGTGLTGHLHWQPWDHSYHRCPYSNGWLIHRGVSPLFTSDRNHQ